MKQYKQIFYLIGFLILLIVVGYLLADSSWNIVMDTLTATEVPSPSPAPTPNEATPQASHPSEFTEYEFPHAIDPAKQYLFYLHGRIIEEQGVSAVSPEFGAYEYEAILEKLRRHGFVVISEQRPKNTEGVEYANRVTEQITTLLNAGVPAKNITVVGASKGAGIAVYISHFLANEEINFVIMGICHPDEVEGLKQQQISLYGNVLSIYDSADYEFAGSCEELFSFSEANGGLSRHDEIVLNIGTGHGILYKPLDEWILPTVQWANKNAD
jgi:hypothetical protein